MNLLLDTSVLIDILRARKDRRALLADLTRKGHNLGTTAINIAEIHAGMRTPEKRATEFLLADLRCFDITASIGILAGNLKNAFARKGKTLDLLDMLIAATALEYGLTLLTDNRKDFPIPDLNLYPLP